MRKLKAKIGLLVIALSFVFVGVLSLKPVETAKADVNTSSGFVMLQGAAVKATTDIDKNFRGISWVTSVSSSFYTASGFNGSERFGAVIAPTGSFEGELTKDTVLTSGSVKLFELEQALDASSEDRTYRTIVDFSHVPGNKFQAACAMELTARAYVRVGSNYYYAPTAGSSRSMRQVAVAADNYGDLKQFEDSDDDYAQSVAAYIREFYLYGTGKTSMTTKTVAMGAAGTPVINLESVPSSLSLNLTLTEGSPEDSSTEICIGAERIVGASYSDKVLTLPSLTSYTFSAGEACINIFADGVVYRIPLIVATKVFTSMDDFNIFNNIRNNLSKNRVKATLQTVEGVTAKNIVQSGYYVLDRDLDASSYNPTLGDGSGYVDGITSFVGTEMGLKGTFNGMGHTINGLKLSAPCSGLFQFINGGTVKNLALTNVSTTSEERYIAPLAWYMIDATIENVYIQADSLAAQYQFMLAYRLYATVAGKFNINNVFFDVAYRAMTGSTYVRAGICDHGSFDETGTQLASSTGAGQRGAGKENTVEVSNVFAVSNLGGLYYYKNDKASTDPEVDATVCKGQYFACGYGDNLAASVRGDATTPGTQYIRPSFTTLPYGNNGATPDIYYAGAVCYETQAQFESAVSSLDFSSLVDSGCWSLDGSGLPVWTGDVVLTINDEAPMDLTINSVDSNTQTPFEVSITKDGGSITPTSISITSGGTYATWDSAKSEIVSNGYYGDAVVTISYTAGGTAFTKTVNVHVVPTMREYDGTITNFSAINGDARIGTTLAEAFGAGFTSAYNEDGTALTVTHTQETVEEVLVDYYKIYDVATSKTGITEKTLTLYNASYGMYVPISGYTGVFTEIEDFEFFQGIKNNNRAAAPTTVYYGYADGVDTATTVYNGYYVLANDIDATGYEAFSSSNTKTWHNTMANFASREIGLSGTFDGQHHTISNLEFSNGSYTGLFPLINGGTVKDLALTSLKTKITSEYIAALAWYAINAHVEDVFISTSSFYFKDRDPETDKDTYTYPQDRFCLFGRIFQSSANSMTLERVLIDGGNGTGTNTAWNAGDICYNIHANSDMTFAWNNVVTVSGYGLSIAVSSGKTLSRVYYGLNETEDGLKNKNDTDMWNNFYSNGSSATATYTQLPAYHFFNDDSYVAACVANTDIKYREWTDTGKWDASSKKGIYWA